MDQTRGCAHRPSSSADQSKQEATKREVKGRERRSEERQTEANTLRCLFGMPLEIVDSKPKQTNIPAVPVPGDPEQVVREHARQLAEDESRHHTRSRQLPGRQGRKGVPGTFRGPLFVPGDLCVGAKALAFSHRDVANSL